MKIDTINKLKFSISVMLVVILVWQTLVLDQTIVEDRKYEPVVVVGAKFPAFANVPVSEIFMYAFKNGNWSLMPFQIDEQTYGPDSVNTLTYRWWYFIPKWWEVDSINITSHDSLLSGHDELVFMVRDLGERAASDNWIDNLDSKSHNRIELEIVDPMDPNQKNYGYLYRSSTITEEIPTPYRFNTTPANNYIENVNYAVRLGSTSGMIEDIIINPPLGNGVDIFDTQKIRFSGVLGLGPFPITIGRNNRPAANERDNFYVYDRNLRPEDLDVIKYTANPVVRVLQHARQTIRFGSLDLGEIGFFFFVDSKFYPFSGTLEGGADLNPDKLKELFNLEDDVFIEMDLLRQSWDFNAAAAGMKFYNKYNNGVNIDGHLDSPDKKIDVPINEWFLTTGDQGSIFTQIKFQDTSWQSIELYLYDNLAGGQGDNTMTPGGDTGDLVSYGDQGILFKNLAQDSVSLKLGFTAYFLEKNLQQSDGFQLSDAVTNPVTVLATTNNFTSVDEKNQGTTPQEFQLLQNYPNPFNSLTKISFALPNKDHVVLKIFDISGRLVKTLANNFYPAGTHEIVWNGKDESGVNVASGIYLYEIKTERNTASKKLVLLY